MQESLPDAIPEDAQGNILHDNCIAQWQEHSWIYKAIVKSLNDNVKATIAPWHDSIALDEIILFFVLIQGYVATSNDALIIMYDQLREENNKLSKFDNDVKNMVAQNRGSSRLIQACGEQVSRQMFTNI